MSEETLAQQGARIFGGLADAMIDGMHEANEVNELNKALIANLPENPERGSYYWWVKLTRQNTGQSLCDSGMVYGYRYNTPYAPEDSPPVTIDYEAIPRISLPHFLSAHFDAADESAKSLEDLMMWSGTWLWPREYWRKCIDEFVERDLPLMLVRYDGRLASRDTIDKDRGWPEEPSYSDLETFLPNFMSDIVSKFFDSKGYASDFADFQRNMTREEFIAAALKDFPMDALEILREKEVEYAKDELTFYTYNQENDFDQDWMIDAWIEVDGSACAVIRTHNGCDARGGYSSPVIAAVNDRDYMYTWLVDFYCRECGEVWDMSYRFNDERVNGREYTAKSDDGEWERKHYDPVKPPSPELIKETLDGIAPIERGQLVLDGVQPPECDLPLDKADALALLKHYDKAVADGDDPEDYEYPPFVIDMEDGSVVCDTDRGVAYPADAVRLWCPRCEKYSVTLGDPTQF